MSDPQITIVGGGMSAVYSYWGALDAGYKPHEIEVITATRQHVSGAIFMYASPIPWVDTRVISILLGTAEGYAKNQWGDDSIITSAHARFAASNRVEEFLYDPVPLLTILWSMIPIVRKMHILTDNEIARLKDVRKAVICTFANSATHTHYREDGALVNFLVSSQKIDHSLYCVVYNGDTDLPWVRQTFMPGRVYTEYPHTVNSAEVMDFDNARGRDGLNIQRVTDLDPLAKKLTWEERKEGNLFRVGRMACFERGYLSHQARFDTTLFLEQL